MTDREFNWWNKNYPHEAETIVTMCQLFDEADDEAIKAQLDYVIGLLRKKEEYRWHDLRKDSTDLPEKDGWVECWLYIENTINYSMDLYFYTNLNAFKDNRRRDVFNVYEVNGFDIKETNIKKQIYADELCDRTSDVIAWRYIESFEG